MSAAPAASAAPKRTCKAEMLLKARQGLPGIQPSRESTFTGQGLRTHVPPPRQPSWDGAINGRREGTAAQYEAPAEQKANSRRKVPPGHWKIEPAQPSSVVSSAWSPAHPSSRSTAATQNGAVPGSPDVRVCCSFSNPVCKGCYDQECSIVRDV